MTDSKDTESKGTCDPKEERETEDEKETPAVLDPQEILREKCRSHCQVLDDELNKCNERVRSKSQTTEICLQELVDLIHCVEHCVSPDLFKRLK